MSRLVEVLLRELNVAEALVVGHSMGGMVALELSAAAPLLVAGLVLVDTVLWPEPEISAAIRSTADLLDVGQWDKAREAVTQALFLPSDDPAVRRRFQQSYDETDPMSLAKTFSAHLIDYNPGFAASVLKRPILYIGTETPLASLPTLTRRIEGVKTARAVGSGHFAPLLVPDQVNAMIDDFIYVHPGL